MILTCPACSTQYVVKDGAIPPGGRQVRCASCKHSWHQDPEAIDTADDDEAGVSDAAPSQPAGDDAGDRPGDFAAEDSEADVEAVEPAGYSAVDPIAPTEEVAEDEGFEDTLPAEEALPASEAAEAFTEWQPRPRDDEFSPFADRAVPVEGRGSPMRGLMIGLLVLVLLAAAFWFLAPADWKARVGLAKAAETPLQLMLTHSDRQRLPSGNELLQITGRVINPTNESQTIPPIQAQLRNGAGQLVYSWTIAPPARTLAPGASATFNSAEVDVPAGGDELTVSLTGSRA